MITQNLPATLNDRLNALKQRASLANEVSYWKPIAGETIAGVIVGSGEFTHPLYGTQKTMLLQAPDGSITSVILTRYLISLASATR